MVQHVTAVRVTCERIQPNRTGFSAAINEQIDKAARMLNSMMEEIHQEAFVSGAVSEVTGATLTVLDYACKP